MGNPTPKAVLASLIAVAMVATGTTSATAADLTSASAVVDDVEAHLEAALATQPEVHIDTASIPEGQIEVQGGVVSAPSANEEQAFSMSLDGSALDGVGAHLTRHAITQAAARGVSQALIKQVVQNGVKTAGQKGTSVFTQGSGANRIRVIVDDKTGNVITVTKG